MPLIQRFGALSGGFEFIEQRTPRAVGNPLSECKLEFAGSPLDVASIDMRGLIFGVQHEPELHARIGDRNLDATLPCVV